MTPSHRQHGFSLVELMVTITVAAILVAIALPNFRDVIHRNQVSSASNSLLASLQYARAEAINRGQMVYMCPGTKAGCTATSKAFEPGWIVYTPPAGAASVAQAYKSAFILLRVVPPQSGVSIQAKATEIITFGQQGQLKSATSPAPPLDFVTCYRTGSSGTGSSTTPTKGVELKINGYGSISSSDWAVGTACTPT